MHLGRSLAPAAGVLAGLSLLAAGCGGSEAPAVANVGTTTAGTSAAASSKAPPSQSQLEQEALAYARCMRSHGLPNFPDPTAGGGFMFSAGSGVDPTSPAFKAAESKCRKYQASMGGLAPGTQTHPTAAWLGQMVKAAQCMRRHGVSSFPDPLTQIPSDPFPKGGAGIISDIDGAVFVFPSSIGVQSPQFVRAATACHFPLHNH
jgi:hypothetical protein